MSASTKNTSSSGSSSTNNPLLTQQYNNAVSTLGNSSYSPVTSQQIAGYESPYTSSVVNATDAENAQSEQQQLNNNTDQAIKSGAFDSNGPSVANALTQGQFALANNTTNAQLNQANYSQALQTASSQNAAQNQYPLAVQQLLGSLAAGTGSNATNQSNSTTTSLGGNLAATLNPATLALQSVGVGGG